MITPKEVKQIIFDSLRAISHKQDIISYHKGMVFYLYSDSIYETEFFHPNLPLDVMYIFSSQIQKDVIFRGRPVTIFYERIDNFEFIDDEYDEVTSILMVDDGDILYDEFETKLYKEFIKPDYTKQNLNIIDELY